MLTVTTITEKETVLARVLLAKRTTGQSSTTDSYQKQKKAPAQRMAWRNYKYGYATQKIRNGYWQNAQALTIAATQPEPPKVHATYQQQQATTEQAEHLYGGCEDEHDVWKQSYPNKSEVLCIACRIELNGPSQWKQHISGKKHRNGIRTARARETSKDVQEIEMPEMVTEASIWLEAGRKAKANEPQKLSRHARRRRRRNERKKREAQEAAHTEDATETTKEALETAEVNPNTEALPG